MRELVSTLRELMPSRRRLVSVRAVAVFTFISAVTAVAFGQSQTVTTTAPSDVSAPPADAQTTSSGLASKVIKPGTGTVHPVATDRVTVNYTGWTTDGQMFDSSITRGRPSRFWLDEVIPGWTEGVQLMVVGETRRLWIPEKLAYKGADPKGMLVFDVELLQIE